MLKNILYFLGGVVLLFLTSCSEKNSKADGYGNFDVHAAVIVSSQTMGRLLRFDVEEGSRLKAGQVVGYVDTIQPYLKKVVLENQKKVTAARLANINASIAVLHEKLQISQTRQRRIQNLFNSKAATQKQLDDINGLVELNKKEIQAAQTSKKSVYAQIQSIDAQIAQMNETIRQCMITNPVTGTVLVKYAEKGELATPGKPLYKIADLKTMELKAFVSGSQLSQLRIGQKVTVYYDKNKKEESRLDGIILWISPQAEFTPKTIQTKQERINLVYAVKIKVPNPHGTLKIGMPGEFRIKIPQSN